MHLVAWGSHGCLWQDTLPSTQLKRASPRVTLPGFNSLPLARCVTLGPSYDVSVHPQPHLENKRPKEYQHHWVVMERASAQYLAHRKYVMNVSCYFHGPELLKGSPRLIAEIRKFSLSQKTD